MTDKSLPDFDIWKQLPYKGMKWVTYERLLEIVSNDLQEGEMSEYAYGWKQIVLLGFTRDSDTEMVPIFTQDFKEYCKHLEKTRLLPFNFL